MLKSALQKWWIVCRWTRLLQLPVPPRSHRYVVHSHRDQNIDLCKIYIWILKREMGQVWAFRQASVLSFYVYFSEIQYSVKRFKWSHRKVITCKFCNYAATWKPPFLNSLVKMLLFWSDDKLTTVPTNREPHACSAALTRPCFPF